MESSRGWKCIFVALVLTMLSACGGGGGSDDSTGGGSSGGNNLSGAPPPTNSPNVPPPSNDPDAPVAVGAFAYVANHGGLEGGNISAYSINETTGALSEIPGSPFAAGLSPTDIAITPSGKFAYVLNGGGNVMIYSIDAMTGALTRVGAPVTENLGFPVSIAIHPSGRALYVASQWQAGSGNDHLVSAFAIDGTTGLLSSIGTTVLGSLPLSIRIDPAGRFAYVTAADLTPATYMSVYAIDSTQGTLSQIAGSPFVTSGYPSTPTVVPSGRFAYVSTSDFSGSGTYGYEINATTGAPSQIAGSPFRDWGLVSVHPSGKFAYGLESIRFVTFAINENSGALTIVSTTEWSGHVPLLAFSPSAKFVYEPIRESNVVNMAAVDPNTGIMTHIGTIGTGNLPEAIAITTTYR